jgi:hypothetical protein
MTPTKAIDILPLGILVILIDLVRRAMESRRQLLQSNLLNVS